VFLGLAQSLSLKDTIIPAVYFIRDVWIADKPEHKTLCRSTVCEVCKLIRDIYQAISQPNTLLGRSKPFTHQARHPCPQPLLNVVSVASPWTPA
jgi:hypothetical protein